MAERTYAWTPSAARGFWSLPAVRPDVAAPASDPVAVDGEAPDQFEILLGPYAASALTLTDDVALEQGLFAVGALTLSDTSGLAGATDILAGATLAASGATTDQGNVEVNGSGASFTTAGALTQTNPAGDLPGGDVYVVNGASLQAGSWTADGFVFVDATSSATVGAAAATQKGVVSVQQGATLTLGGEASIAADVVDAGTVAAGRSGPFVSEVISGSLSGDGALAVAPGAMLAIAGATSGLPAITIADGTSATGGGELSSQSVSDVGAIAVGEYGVLTVYGALQGAGAISVGASATVRFGQLSAAGAITVGSFGELIVSGPLLGTGAISFGADGTGSFEQVSDTGEIDVGQFGDVDFAGDVSGSSALKVASGATVSMEATLSGLSGAALASGATLNFGGEATDADVPISLAGDDTIGVADGATVDGAVSGFDVTDAITCFSEPPGTIVTGASLNASGLLSLTTDLAQTASVQLAGVAAGQRFLAIGVGDLLPAGEELVVLAGAASAVPQGGAVVGGTANSFHVLTGSGSGPGLDFTGDNAMFGSASTDDLTVGGQNQAADDPDASENALLIEAGGSVTATGTADIQSNLEVDGAGAALDVAGTLTFGGRDSPSELAAVDGGRIRLGGLDVASGTGPDANYEATTLLIDPTGAIEVGTGGGAAAGALTIDAGEAVTSSAYMILDGDVVDGGSLETLAFTQVYGGVSGAGSLMVDALETAVSGSVTGLTGVGVGVDASLGIEGSLDTTASVTTGEGSELYVQDASDLAALATGFASQTYLDGAATVGGAVSIGENAGASFGGLSSTGPMEIGQGSSVTAYGTVSIGGTITVGETATAFFFGDLSSTGAMEIGQGASVTIEGTVSATPQITLDARASLSLSAADDGVGVTFAGSQGELAVQDFSPVNAALTGFGGTDLLVNEDFSSALGGGQIVTAATYAATGAGLGTLTLTDDGTVLNTFTLAGAYTPGEFLANAALVDETDRGATDVTLAGPTQTGLSGATVTGGLGSVFDVLAGLGTSAGALTFDDNVAVEGAFVAAGITLAGITDEGVVDIEAGASLTSTAGASVHSGAEVDGSGALLAAQSLTLGGGSGDADLLVVNGGAVQAASLTLFSAVPEPTTTLFVDGTGSVEVGAAAAVAGTVRVAAGATLTDDAALGQIFAAVDDDGAITVVAPSASGATAPDTLEIEDALTGAGTLQVADGQGAELVSGAEGLSSVVVGAQSSLTSDGGISNIGTLALGADAHVLIADDVTDAGGIGVGADATLTIDGAVADAGGIAVGAGASVAIYGDATGAGVIGVGAGASLMIAGALSGSGALLVGAGASATIGGDVSDLSGITLDAGATLDLGGDETGVPISIVGQGVTLDIMPGATITGEITGFAHGDVIQLPEDAFDIITTATDAGGTLTLSDDGTTWATLSLAGSYAGQQFISNVAGAGGYSDVVVSSPPCFAAGTRILTAQGEVAVEALKSGDQVVVLDGAGRALLPVRWIGRRRIDLSRHPNPALAQPILIRAHALADGAPVRDLLVSPDHALLLDGALVAARLLVNGASVVRVTDLACVSYFHVELERHAVLLADGAAAESYLDTGNRMIFSNGEECVQLHPDFAAAPDAARRAARSCAELLTDPERLQPIWRRIAERAGEPADLRAAVGCALPGTRDARPRLLAAGRIRAPAPTGGDASRLVFPLPAGVQTARLVSRAAAPSETAPWHDDRRRLGLLVRRLTFHGPRGPVPLPLDDPRLAGGWWAVEPADGEVRRWTDGDALLPVPPHASTLEVELADVGRYPLKTRPRPSARPGRAACNRTSGARAQASDAMAC